MTVDVYVKEVDEGFIEEIDEIKEESMVEIFLVHPRDESALEEVKKTASQLNGLFYCAPLSLKESCDDKCLAYYLDQISLLDESVGTPLYVNADDLTQELQSSLIQGGHKGIILNATKLYEELSDFFVAIGPSNVSRFDMAVLANASMDKIVLQSAYPEHQFDEIFQSVKVISSALFRPEESIIARATQHSLTLFGLKNR